MKSNEKKAKILFGIAGLLAVSFVLMAFVLYVGLKQENEELNKLNVKVVEELQETQNEQDVLSKDFEEAQEKIEKVTKDYTQTEKEKEVIKQQNESLIKQQRELETQKKELEKKLKDAQALKAEKLEKQRLAKLERKQTTPAPKTTTLASTVKDSEVSTASSRNSRWITMNASAYTAKCAGCIGITKTGVDIRNQSIDHRIVAVDPSVIPLGSKVEVEGYGIFTALDTGGAIKGHRIDVLMQSEGSANQFGRKNIRVRVVGS